MPYFTEERIFKIKDIVKIHNFGYFPVTFLDKI